MFLKRLSNPYVLGEMFCMLILMSALFSVEKGIVEQKPAEGKLHETALLSGMPAYPGDGIPLYPGDEKWDGRFQKTPAFPAGTDLNTITTGSDGSVYVGGSFTQAGGIAANNIVRWDGNQWYALGSGVNGTVYGIAVNGKDVYVGGSFTQAGGKPAYRIARWDGSQWYALGGGLNSVVVGVAVSGSNVYVSGGFGRAGGQPALYVAQWDGNQWKALGSGVAGGYEGGYAYLFDIAASGSDMYVGGFYLVQAGGKAVSNIAHWDGNQWHDMGGGVNAGVEAIHVKGRDVYVVGGFNQAGGQSINNIARWDGSQWHTVCDTAVKGISELDFSGKGFYAAGKIDHVPTGAYFANGIIRWDGSQWSNLGSGLTRPWTMTSLTASSATDVAVLADRVVVIGDFSYAGNKVSPRFAIWHTVPEVDLNFTNGAPGSTFRVTGRYFPANSAVTLAINGLVQGSGLATDAYGEIRFNLTTSPQAAPGYYHITLAAGEVTGSASYQLISGGTVRPIENGVPTVQTPATVLPAIRTFLPVMYQ